MVDLKTDVVGKPLQGPTEPLQTETTPATSTTVGAPQTPQTSFATREAVGVVDGGRLPGITLPSGPGSTAPITRPRPSGATVTPTTANAPEIFRNLERLHPGLERPSLSRRIFDGATAPGREMMRTASDIFARGRELWQGNVGEKIGAVFSFLGGALMYALGGVVWGVGAVIGGIGAGLALLGGGGAGRDAKAEGKEGEARERDAKETQQELGRQLEALKREAKDKQIEVLTELANLTGISGTGPLDAAQRRNVSALLMAADKAGLDLPGANEALLNRFPAGERGAVAPYCRTVA